MKHSTDHTCPACGGSGMELFYEVRQLPVHSVLLLPTREAALTYPKGDISLGLCTRCGFIGNLAFDPSVHEYSTRYEETQGFSGTFAQFHKALAQRLIDRYDLHNKTVIEIGCGKGEFLTMLCEMGPNNGVGVDPAYVAERNTSPAKDRMTFVQDLYSEKYSHIQGDMVICKMTLEHIPDVAAFVGTVRRSMKDRHDTVVFFQIPDVARILAERAFWDIYYEHCSYFSKGSLGRLFRKCGFNVIDLATEYDDQYLMVDARPSKGTPTPPLPQEDDLERIIAAVGDFEKNVEATLSAWERRLTEWQRQGRKVVIWGGGSKGVAFLTKLGIVDQIRYAVDINPYKHGTFMAGTGQEIVGPEFLKDYRPDTVIVMNPIYCREIQEDLDRLGVRTEVMPIVEEEHTGGR